MITVYVRSNITLSYVLYLISQSLTTPYIYNPHLSLSRSDHHASPNSMPYPFLSDCKRNRVWLWVLSWTCANSWFRSNVPTTVKCPPTWFLYPLQLTAQSAMHSRYNLIPSCPRPYTILDPNWCKIDGFLSRPLLKQRLLLSVTSIESHTNLLTTDSSFLYITVYYSKSRLPSRIRTEPNHQSI